MGIKNMPKLSNNKRGFKRILNTEMEMEYILKGRTPDTDVLYCNVYKCIKLQSENRGLTEAGNYCTQYKNHAWTSTPYFVLYCVE